VNDDRITIPQLLGAVVVSLFMWAGLVLAFLVLS
jgi:hypothetical protein